MEYLGDYHFTLSFYHPGKVNVMADVHSRKTKGLVANIAVKDGR